MYHDNNAIPYLKKLYESKTPQIPLPGKATDVMQSNFIVSGALKTVACMIKAKKIMEIGTLYGYSTLSIAQGLDEDAEILTIEKNPDNLKSALKNFAAHPPKCKITPILGNASTILNGMSLSGSFDMIFIDANKSAYMEYLTWAETNIIKGGVIIADNILLFDTVWQKDENVDYTSLPITRNTAKNMRKFNERLADAKLYKSFTIPYKSGLTIAIKQF